MGVFQERCKLVLREIDWGNCKYCFEDCPAKRLIRRVQKELVELLIAEGCTERDFEIWGGDHITYSYECEQVQQVQVAST